MSTGSIRGLIVVVPAHDEEALLPPCLQSVNQAVQALHVSRPDIGTAVVVVADRCSDRTVPVAREAGAHVVRVDEGCVGTARRSGVEAGIALMPHVAQDQMWIASTDADTQVPPAWLRHQMRLAASGVRLVIGRAVPDRNQLDARVWRRWQERHASSTVGTHVHGANLGFRHDDYRAAGGWARLVEHEDRSLVEALVAAGAPAATGLEVITSARLVGRAPGGFSGYLRTLVSPSNLEDASPVRV